jgi:hypothetical protein
MSILKLVLGTLNLVLGILNLELSTWFLVE